MSDIGNDYTQTMLYLKPDLVCKNCGEGSVNFTHGRVSDDGTYIEPHFGDFCSAGCLYTFPQRQRDNKNTQDK